MSDTPDPRLGKPSASKWGITMACPGSRALIASIPPEKRARDPEDDELAAMGARIHKARELMQTPDDPKERRLYERGLNFERDLVRAWMKDNGLTLQDVREGPREERFWLHDPETLEPLVSGQPDVIYLASVHALLIDWKSLYCTNLPATPQSAQLRLQAVLLDDNTEGLLQIRVAYDKPMTYNGGKDDYTDYTRMDLDYARRDVFYFLWLANRPDAPRYPGPECRWCEARDYCREAAAWSMLPSVVKEGKHTVVAPDPEQVVKAMTPEDLVQVWRFKPLVENIMKQAVGRLKGFDAKTLADLGLEKDKGKALDPIVATLEAFRYLQSQGWTDDQIFKCLSFSKGSLEEVYIEREGLTEEYAKKRLDDDFAPFIERKRSEPGLKMMKGITR